MRNRRGRGRRCLDFFALGTQWIPDKSGWQIPSFSSKETRRTPRDRPSAHIVRSGVGRIREKINQHVRFDLVALTMTLGL